MTPLSALLRIEELRLAANAVVEIAALRDLPSILYLEVSGNPLSAASLAALQVLTARGVEVRNEVYVPEDELPTPELPGFGVVYFGTSANANHDLFVLRSDQASDPANLTRMAGQYRELGLSPDGSLLAYLSDREDRWSWHLYLLDLRTGLSRRVTVDPIGESFSSFAMSPDGTTIAAARSFWLPSTSRHYAEVYLIDAATGRTTDLTRRHESTVFHGSPAWSPDGSRLAVDRYRMASGGVTGESSPGPPARCSARSVPSTPAAVPWRT